MELHHRTSTEEPQRRTTTHQTSIGPLFESTTNIETKFRLHSRPNLVIRNRTRKTDAQLEFVDCFDHGFRYFLKIWWASPKDLTETGMEKDGLGIWIDMVWVWSVFGAVEELVGMGLVGDWVRQWMDDSSEQIAEKKTQHPVSFCSTPLQSTLYSLTSKSPSSLFLRYWFSFCTTVCVVF